MEVARLFDRVGLEDPDLDGERSLVVRRHVVAADTEHDVPFVEVQEVGVELHGGHSVPRGWALGKRIDRN